MKVKRATLRRVAAPALLAGAGVLCSLPFPAFAQSFAVLHPFQAAQDPTGGLVRGSDGNFYGTTSDGSGGLGTVFKITPAGVLTTLYSFVGSDGAVPQGTLVQGADGNLYGTTAAGGASGLGTVFKITPAGVLTTLYSFAGSDGAGPHAGLVQGTDGNFFGTTGSGGASGYGGTSGSGTVFKMTPAGTLTTLHSFELSDGAGPQAGLVRGADGDFYGTTAYGGTSGFGTVFKITPTGTLTTLYSFERNDGRNPQATLVQGTDGDFYGTTIVGGASDSGTVFRITPTGTLTTLHSFAHDDGDFPYAGLVQGTDGNFYGTTEHGGTADYGSVFKITPAGTLTTLHFFEGSEGEYPQATLVQGTDGNLYGTTALGGTNGWGAVFKITPAGALTTLYSFTSVNGDYPYYAGLVQGADGSFYGTTNQGGTSDVGTVFKITPAWTLTTLHSFEGSDGEYPYAGLVQGTDGSFYGTTASGGRYGYGAVYKIAPAGALATLYSFTSSDGAYPYAGLVRGTDGNLYGTTSGGGGYGYGAIFKITQAGTLTTLYSFTGSDGEYPYAGLVQGTDGNFYGTTSGGGTSGNGTVFKITPAGTLTALHSFTGSDGAYLYASLLQGTDGNFYGTTFAGGASGHGTVFKITLTGVLTTLYSFAWSDGAAPHAGLAQGTDGNFYGTTGSGGSSGLGTIFKITPAGALTTVHSFAGSDGAFPLTALVQGTDGNFYGTAASAGAYGGGVVFRLTLGPGPSPTVTGVSPASGPASGGSVVAVSGTEFQPGATVSCGAAAATGVTYVSATTIYAVTPVHAAGAVTVNVTNPDLKTGSLASAYTYTCSSPPTALNGGPYCVGATISLSTPTVSGATYAWTGPNGFSSSQQNPTILADTTAWTGTYSVTVTLAGCPSSPGATLVVVNPALAPPVVTAPSNVGAGSPHVTATVPFHGGSTYSWTIGNGTIIAGQGTNQITFMAGTAGTPLTLSVTEQSASHCTSASGNATVTVTAGSAVFLPVVLDNVAGVGGSHYTTELTLASKATTATQVNLLYNTSVGSGTGTVSVTLGPGETRIIPNAVAFLRSQGLSIPTSGSIIGTLLATFDSSFSDPFIGARTFTTGGGGTFGLFYPAAVTTTTTATLVGLQQNDAQRSNLALVNTGGTPITVRVQLFGPLGEDLGTLPDESLPPYGWAQINQPLDGKAAAGRAVITEISGASPYTAYAVLNDAFTSDGSFIPPFIASTSGRGDRLVPIVLDVYGLGSSHYTTELTLTNLASSPLPVTFFYKASLGSGSGRATLTLAPGEQRIVPDAIRFLRSQGLAIPNDGSSVGGSLLVLPQQAGEFAVGARTFTPAFSGGGSFGVYYTGLTLGESTTSVAFVNGLQQNSTQRSNLAVVNRGDAGDPITLNVSYFDGTGAALGASTSVALAPGQWMQFGQPLAALGAASGYARIEKTSGISTFVAYGVLNDTTTSDGSYIPMSF